MLVGLTKDNEHFSFSYLFIYRKECSDDPDLVVQLDVFDDNKIADEEQFSGPEGVDLNNAIDVFHAIFKQVRHFLICLTY